MSLFSIGVLIIMAGLVVMSIGFELKMATKIDVPDDSTEYEGVKIINLTFNEGSVTNGKGEQISNVIPVLSPRQK